MDIVVPVDSRLVLGRDFSGAALGLVGAARADTATALGGLIFGLFFGSLRLQLGGEILHDLSGASLRLAGAARADTTTALDLSTPRCHHHDLLWSQTGMPVGLSSLLGEGHVHDLSGTPLGLSRATADMLELGSVIFLNGGHDLSGAALRLAGATAHMLELGSEIFGGHVLLHDLSGAPLGLAGAARADTATALGEHVLVSDHDTSSGGGDKGKNGEFHC